MKRMVGAIGVVVLGAGSACAKASESGSTTASAPVVTYTASGPGFDSVYETAAFAPSIVVATVRPVARSVRDPAAVPSAVAHVYTLSALVVERALRGPRVGAEIPLLTLADTPDWETAPQGGVRAVFFLNPRSRLDVPGIDVPDVVFNLATGAASFMPLDGSSVSLHSPAIVRLAKASPLTAGGLRLTLADIEKVIASIPPGTPTVQDQMSTPVSGFERTNVTPPG